VDDFIASAPDPVCLVSPELVIVKANRAACAFFHCEEGALAGVRMDVVVSDRSVLKGLRDLLAGTASEGAVANVETRLITKSGPVDVLFSAWPVSAAGGGPGGVIFTVRDISVLKRKERELRESREDYQAIVEKSETGIVVVDHDGVVRYINPSGERLLWRKADEIVGTVFGLPIVTDTSIEIKIQRGDKGIGIAEMRAVETMWGNQRAYLTHLHDITEQRKIEAELLRSQKLESVGALAGGIAHDFNNLLTGILGNISLARHALKRSDSATAADRLAEAEKAVERSQGLTRQLLTFSTGGSPVKDTVFIGETVRKTAEFALSGSKARCRYEIDPDLWPVDADEGQISQAVNNVVINADQAMPEGGLMMLIAENAALEPDNAAGVEPGRYVRISVEDTGCGISESYIHSIFDPYFTTKDKGSGLGLATAYAIIKNHGGRITVKSTPGAGSTFYIFIPASGNAMAVDDKETAAAIPGNVRVLALDDEEIIRDVLKEIFSALGCSAEFACEGAQAVELDRAAKASGAPFDLVIMDLTIPGGMGGREAAKRLLEIDPQARLIVSSGYSSDPIMANFRDYGFCGVVSKPYRISDIGRVVKGALAAKTGGGQPPVSEG